jgi:hypothetical protein
LSVPKSSNLDMQVVELVDSKGRKTRPLRSAYSGTVAKGAKIDLTLDQVQKIGEMILEQIREEIEKDTLKASAFRAQGDPVPLPRTKRFAESFKVQVSGKRTLEFTSDWPTAGAHTLGRDREVDLEAKNKSSTSPFPMWWLVRPQVPRARIVTSEGQVIVVTTPSPADGDAMWVHPGFRRYTFLERGIRKGKQRALETLVAEMMTQTISDKGLFPQG